MKLILLPPVRAAVLTGLLGLVWGCQTRSADAQSSVPVISPSAAVVAPPPAVTNQAVVTNQAPAVAEGAVTNLALAPPASAPAKLSPGIEEVVKLAQGGVGDDVVIAYIDNSSVVYELSVEEVLYLSDLGLSEAVITAMIKRGNLLKTNPPMVEAAAPVAPGAPAAAIPAAPAPAVGANGEVLTAPPPVYAQPQQPAPEVQAAAPLAVAPQVTYQYFYDSLAPYGSWSYVDPYGWCWQPTVVMVQPGWRPYSDRGRWLWSDWGWYWQSDYSWGWAPFHYGRWASHPSRGWLWVPDYCWGPSWVTWRYSDAYCGWAPLPPGAYYRHGIGLTYYGSNVSVGFDFGFHANYYTFIPYTYFGDWTPWHYYVPRTKVVNIYNQTTIVNNYIQDTQNNNVIVNNGVSRDRIAALSRSEIKKVAVRSLPPERALMKPDKLAREGNQLVVYRPETSVQPASAAGSRNKQEAQLNRGRIASLPSKSDVAAPRPVSATPVIRPLVNSRVDTVPGKRLASLDKPPIGVSTRANVVTTARPQSQTPKPAISARQSTIESSSKAPAPALSRPAPIRTTSATQSGLVQTPVNRRGAEPVPAAPGALAELSKADRMIQPSSPAQTPLVRTPTSPVSRAPSSPTITTGPGSIRSSPNASVWAPVAGRAPNPVTISPATRGIPQDRTPPPSYPSQAPNRSFENRSPVTVPQVQPIRPSQPSPVRPSSITISPSVRSAPQAATPAPSYRSELLKPPPAIQPMAPSAPPAFVFRGPVAPPSRGAIQTAPSFPASHPPQFSSPSARSMPSPSYAPGRAMSAPTIRSSPQTFTLPAGPAPRSAPQTATARPSNRRN